MSYRTWAEEKYGSSALVMSKKENAMIHTIYFSKVLSQTSVEDLARQCTKSIHEGASHLHLNLATTGGPTLCGFWLYNFLTSLPITVTTHNMGSIESMGLIPFLAGSTRTASPDSRFLIHQMHWSFTHIVEASRLYEAYHRLKSDIEQYVGIVGACLSNSRLDDKKLTQILESSSLVVSPKEAKTDGLIHDITYSVPTPAVSFWI